MDNEEPIYWAWGGEHILARHLCGDRLWVKETYWVDLREPKDCVIYAATPDQHKYRLRNYVEIESEITTDYLENHDFWVRRPSIFMWRWASRLTLEVEEVRVERLQDITEAGAKAEGVVLKGGQGYDGWAKQEYIALWEKINGRGSWDQNPWVFVIRFKKL